MDTVISTNEHGVMICNRTERTDMPEALTRMRYRGSDAVMAQDAMICPFGSFPFYRQRGAFGMDDGGDVA